MVGGQNKFFRGAGVKNVGNPCHRMTVVLCGEECLFCKSFVEYFALNIGPKTCIFLVATVFWPQLENLVKYREFRILTLTC